MALQTPLQRAVALHRAIADYQAVASLPPSLVAGLDKATRYLAAKVRDIEQGRVPEYPFSQ